MSGPMSQAMQAAASRAAEQAQRAYFAAKTRHEVRRMLAERQCKPSESLPGRTWAAMPHKVRITLVMLGGSSTENPQTVAAMPWEAFSDADKASIGAVARELRAGLEAAPCLW